MSGGSQPITRIVLVTGLSGAGKASILRALEDLGYEAVDNPPLPMIEELVVRSDGAGGKRPRQIAIGVDARSRGFEAEKVLATIARLRKHPSLTVHLVFAWADNVALMRRYTESRRRHPLAPTGTVQEGIYAEQTLTAALHHSADLLIDTTDLPLPTLRQMIGQRFGETAALDSAENLSISLISFAFPAGLPRESDMVFDVRFLKNPHYVPELKPKTGFDADIGAFIQADPDFHPFFSRLVGMLDLLLPRFVQEGKKYVTIATGCTGGKHRSVYITERLAAHLLHAGWRVNTTHRELVREGMAAHSASVRGERGPANPSVQAQEA